ncbi:hypothetical protein M5689_007530 [Euphorbia peplus]|nr:hypothetical protein M5689_007530 [Euphorbia peplus]
MAKKGELPEGVSKEELWACAENVFPQGDDHASPTHVKCPSCDRHFLVGHLERLGFHLALVPGQGVDICPTPKLEKTNKARGILRLPALTEAQFRSIRLPSKRRMASRTPATAPSSLPLVPAGMQPPQTMPFRASSGPSSFVRRPAGMQPPHGTMPFQASGFQPPHETMPFQASGFQPPHGAMPSQASGFQPPHGAMPSQASGFQPPRGAMSFQPSGQSSFQPPLGAMSLQPSGQSSFQPPLGAMPFQASGQSSFQPPLGAMPFQASAQSSFQPPHGAMQFQASGQSSLQLRPDGPPPPKRAMTSHASAGLPTSDIHNLLNAVEVDFIKSIAAVRTEVFNRSNILQLDMQINREDYDELQSELQNNRVQFATIEEDLQNHQAQTEAAFEHLISTLTSRIGEIKGNLPPN